MLGRLAQGVGSMFQGLVGWASDTDTGNSWRSLPGTLNGNQRGQCLIKRLAVTVRLLGVKFHMRPTCQVAQLAWTGLPLSHSRSLLSPFGERCLSPRAKGEGIGHSGAALTPGLYHGPGRVSRTMACWGGPQPREAILSSQRQMWKGRVSLHFLDYLGGLLFAFEATGIREV